MADSRIRYLGRFISKEQIAKVLEEQGEDRMDHFFDPIKRVTPKTKKLFKIHRNCERIEIDTLQEK